MSLDHLNGDVGRPVDPAWVETCAEAFAAAEPAGARFLPTQVPGIIYAMRRSFYDPSQVNGITPEIMTADVERSIDELGERADLDTDRARDDIYLKLGCFVTAELRYRPNISKLLVRVVDAPKPTLVGVPRRYVVADERIAYDEAYSHSGYREIVANRSRPHLAPRQNILLGYVEDPEGAVDRQFLTGLRKAVTGGPFMKPVGVVSARQDEIFFGSAVSRS